MRDPLRPWFKALLIKGPESFITKFSASYFSMGFTLQRFFFLHKTAIYYLSITVLTFPQNNISIEVTFLCGALTLTLTVVVYYNTLNEFF